MRLKRSLAVVAPGVLISWALWSYLNAPKPSGADAQSWHLDAAPFPSSAPTGSLAAHAAADPFEACVQTLMTGEERSVRTYIERTFRTSPDDALDLVRDALISVCVRHAQHRYERLGAALRTASVNRATDGWRQRRRYPRCPLDNNVPSCSPAADEGVRFKQEERAVLAALCKEDRVSEQIIRQRVMEDLSFEAIGRELGLTADQTRTMFHNALRRVRQRLSEACGP